MANLELRCSVQSQGAGADPIGTAGAYDAYLLIEVPLPWGRDIADHPRLADVGSVVKASGIETRVLGLVPAREENDAGTTRVIAYRRPPGPFRSYVRREVVVPAGELVAACNDLLGADVAASDVVAEPDLRDVLVCTHGSRDRCCGSFGMNLFTALGDRAGEGVRSWRVSHTGGHRFAPTAIFLPQGHMWAWLDEDLADAILLRKGSPADLIGHYRGSSAMGAAPVQVAEREAFAREGWAWLDATRHGEVVERDGDRYHVRLEFERADGTTGAYEAVVEKDGTIPQPVCGEELSPDGKSDTVWALRRFTAVEPHPSAFVH